jgi:hypothetical protein
MPMREPLRLRNSPHNSSAAANFGRAILLLLDSPDFTAVAAFAGGGIVASLKLALAYPVAIEVVALFAQTS